MLFSIIPELCEFKQKPAQLTSVSLIIRLALASVVIVKHEMGAGKVQIPVTNNLLLNPCCNSRKHDTWHFGEVEHYQQHLGSRCARPQQILTTTVLLGIYPAVAATGSRQVSVNPQQAAACFQFASFVGPKSVQINRPQSGEDTRSLRTRHAHG